MGIKPIVSEIWKITSYPIVFAIVYITVNSIAYSISPYQSLKNPIWVGITAPINPYELLNSIKNYSNLPFAQFFTTLTIHNPNLYMPMLSLFLVQFLDRDFLKIRKQGQKPILPIRNAAITSIVVTYLFAALSVPYYVKEINIYPDVNISSGSSVIGVCMFATALIEATVGMIRTEKTRLLRASLQFLLIETFGVALLIADYFTSPLSQKQIIAHFLGLSLFVILIFGVRLVIWFTRKLPPQRSIEYD